jgi:hypothetical protein
VRYREENRKKRRKKDCFTHLVYPQVGIRADDRASREVHSLAREVPAEAPLLALQSLTQTAHGLAAHELTGDAGALAVDEQSHLGGERNGKAGVVGR